MTDETDAAEPPPVPPAATASIEKAGTVNVGGPAPIDVPQHYAWIVSSFAIAVLAGFGVITYFVLSGDLGRGIDAATKGSVIQTWNNLAVAASSVWGGTKLVDLLARRKPAP